MEEEKPFFCFRLYSSSSFCPISFQCVLLRHVMKQHDNFECCLWKTLGSYTTNHKRFITQWNFTPHCMIWSKHQTRECRHKGRHSLHNVSPIVFTKPCTFRSFLSVSLYVYDKDVGVGTKVCHMVKEGNVEKKKHQVCHHLTRFKESEFGHFKFLFDLKASWVSHS